MTRELKGERIGESRFRTPGGSSNPKFVLLFCVQKSHKLTQISFLPADHEVDLNSDIVIYIISSV